MEINVLEDCINLTEKWIEDHKYKGYDPFDGLSSILRPLTFGNLLFDRLLMQLIRQSPINLRPIFRVKPLESNIARGYIAWGYLNRLKITGNSIFEEKAAACLNWLMENKSPSFNKYSWGKQFNYASRGGRYNKLEPIIVWSGIIGQVFLDAYEILNKKKYLNVAISICKWILDLPKETTDSGICLSYIPDEVKSIHNSNMLGAALLARTAKFIGNTTYLKIAKEAMLYSCSRLLPNGAWYYGEAPEYHWIDNFHTGYNLDSLKCYIENTNDKTFKKDLHRGYTFYTNNFFEENGRPKYYYNRLYPIDIQCASQAIDTLTYFSDYDESALDTAKKVAVWTIKNMFNKKGYFYYRILPFMKVRIPMIHWGQSTTYKALTYLLLKLKNQSS